MESGAKIQYYCTEQITQRRGIVLGWPRIPLGVPYGVPRLFSMIYPGFNMLVRGNAAGWLGGGGLRGVMAGPGGRRSMTLGLACFSNLAILLDSFS